MARRPVPESQIISRVNVTPIIDVALVLVIILLVTAPMLSVTNLPVDLPAARTREAEDERNVSLTLAADGSFAVDERQVTRDQVVAALAEQLGKPGNADVLVVVRADTGTPYGMVKGVLEDARRAGAKRIAIATRQRTAKDTP